MIVHLALQGGLDHHLGQPAQQYTFPRQLETLSTRPINQLPEQLLLRAFCRLGYHIHRHNSHRCPVSGGAVVVTVPNALSAT